MTTLDLFGEPRVAIPDNPTLERVANLILMLVKSDPKLLDGDKVGDIDRQIRLAAWMSQGLADILHPDQLEDFTEWATDPRKCVDPELLRRARQWLVQYDYIRMSADAVRDAERQRSRVTGMLKR